MVLVGLIGFVGESSPYHLPPVQAQEGGQVVFQLKKVRVQDLTGCALDSDCFGDNDEPYFPMITFRSRLFENGSTNTTSPIGLLEFASLDEDPDEDEGNEADIPSDAGQVTFENVHLSTRDSIAEGDFPEVLGVVVLGLEHEHSFDEVRDKINDQRPEIENQLRDWIESGALVDKLATALDSDSGDGGGEPGDDENGECKGLKEILDQIPGSSDSPEKVDLLVGALTGFLFKSPLAGLLGYALADQIIQFYADDFVYAHIFVYVTARDPDFNLDI
jgi:hypothetical protein